MGQINEWLTRIALLNHTKGWYDTERSFGEDMALLHSEVSEAFEEFRNGGPTNILYYVKDAYGNEKPMGIASELADIFIRLCDTADRFHVDLEEAISIKHDYNKTRPHRHGGKVL